MEISHYGFIMVFTVFDCAAVLRIEFWEYVGLLIENGAYPFLLL